MPFTTSATLALFVISVPALLPVLWIALTPHRWRWFRISVLLTLPFVIAASAWIFARHDFTLFNLVTLYLAPLLALKAIAVWLEGKGRPKLARLVPFFGLAYPLLFMYIFGLFAHAVG